MRFPYNSIVSNKDYNWYLEFSFFMAILILCFVTLVLLREKSYDARPL